MNTVTNDNDFLTEDGLNVYEFLSKHADVVPGTITIIHAATGMGKTTAMVQLAKYLYQEDKNPLFLVGNCEDFLIGNLPEEINKKVLKQSAPTDIEMGEWLEGAGALIVDDLDQLFPKIKYEKMRGFALKHNIPVFCTLTAHRKTLDGSLTVIEDCKRNENFEKNIDTVITIKTVKEGGTMKIVLDKVWDIKSNDMMQVQIQQSAI